MGLFYKLFKPLTLITAVTVGIVFLYYVPITESLFSLKPTPDPTATPDYSGWRSYTNQKYGLSLKYPMTFQLVPGKSGPLAEWQLYGVTNGVEIVSIEIPRSSQVLTNFLGASLRVGFSADATAIKECLSPPSSFGYKNSYQERTIGGETFRTFTRSDAGAGNFYDFTSYRAIRNGGCEVFEYAIHKTNIENYPTESRRKEYDREKVVNSMEAMLDTVRFSK